MSIKELQAQGLRYAIVDTRNGLIAGVFKAWDDCDAFPFTPREYAIVDLKDLVAFNESESWNYIPDEWDFQE